MVHDDDEVDLQDNYSLLS